MLGSRKDSVHQETADDYVGVLVRLNPNWRVVNGACELQWIVQRKRGERRGRARWIGVHYCRTRSALMRLCHVECGDFDPQTEALFAALPERFFPHRQTESLQKCTSRQCMFRERENE